MSESAEEKKRVIIEAEVCSIRVYHFAGQDGVENKAGSILDRGYTLSEQSERNSIS